MELLTYFVLVIFLLLAPYLMLRQQKRWAWWSPVMACFAVGFLVGNTATWWMPTLEVKQQSKDLVTGALAGSVLLAIPLLLMTSDLRAFRRLIGPFFISFIICIGTVIFATLVATYFFADLEELPIAAGSLSAVYIGGTPNMAAVLYALQASENLSGILIATDTFWSGLYFLFLVSGAKWVYGKILPAPDLEEKQFAKAYVSTTEILDAEILVVASTTPLPPAWTWARIRPILLAVLAAIACIGLSAGAALLFPNVEGGLNELVLMLVLTTVSLLLSFWPRLRNLLGVYDFAQYLMLIFALAIGYLVDFSTLIGTGGYYLTFNGVLLALLLLFHVLVARLFRIDAHTFILTATACIMGPPFIGSVCDALDRRTLVAPGMALAVVGLIIGTYVGVALAVFLQGYYG
jgi:uncharacterized membrane protein